jgi:antitoxin ParD1/3/4
MATVEFDLNIQDEALIADLIASGQFKSAEEVLREGLRMIELRQEEDLFRSVEVRAKVQAGLDDLAAGRFVTLSGDEELESYLEGLEKRVLDEARCMKR